MQDDGRDQSAGHVDPPCSAGRRVRRPAGRLPCRRSRRFREIWRARDAPDRRRDGPPAAPPRGRGPCHPGRDLRDLGDALCSTTRSTRSRSGTASRPSAGRPTPTAFDRRLAEVGDPCSRRSAASRTSGSSPPHDEPADLAARLGQRLRGRRRGPADGRRRRRAGARGRSPAPLGRGRGARAPPAACARRRAPTRPPRRSSAVLLDAFGVGEDARGRASWPRRAVARRPALHPLPRAASTGAGRGRRGGRRSTALTYLSSIGTVASGARPRPRPARHRDGDRRRARAGSEWIHLGVFADNAGRHRPVRAARLRAQRRARART